MVKIKESDIDDRWSIGRHHEFVHMCGGESLAKPEFLNRIVWENWYNKCKDDPFLWIIDVNGHCIGSAGFHNIFIQDNSATYRICIFDPSFHSKELKQKSPNYC